MARPGGGIVDDDRLHEVGPACQEQLAPDLRAVMAETAMSLAKWRTVSTRMVS
jgi:hypothetical protein